MLMIKTLELRKSELKLSDVKYNIIRIRNKILKKTESNQMKTEGIWFQHPIIHTTQRLHINKLNIKSNIAKIVKTNNKKIK